MAEKGETTSTASPLQNLDKNKLPIGAKQKGDNQTDETDRTTERIKVKKEKKEIRCRLNERKNRRTDKGIPKKILSLKSFR